MGLTGLDLAIGWRAGAAMSVEEVPTRLADPPIHQYAATERIDAGTPAGGAGRTHQDARAAAIGELLERYAGARCPVPVITRAEADARVLSLEEFSLHSPEQRERPDFPLADDYRRDAFTRVWNLLDNTPAHAPTALVSTDPAHGHLATSSGLAAAPTMVGALLRATQELVERDALVTTWLHGIAAPRVRVRLPLARAIGADVTVLDITPAYSPHPVALVAGSSPIEGRPRRAVGLACRSDWDAAVAKAEVEWAQSLAFVSARGSEVSERPEPDEVTSFDDHALFYSARGDLWDALPAFRGPECAAREPARQTSDAAQLHELVTALADAGVEVWYRDLSMRDTLACGVKVARVLAPQLVGIHCDHRWPHLGGRASDLQFRYPGATSATGFPSPYPHPLG